MSIFGNLFGKKENPDVGGMLADDMKRMEQDRKEILALQQQYANQISQSWGAQQNAQQAQALGQHTLSNQLIGNGIAPPNSIVGGFTHPVHIHSNGNMSIGSAQAFNPDLPDILTDKQKTLLLSNENLNKMHDEMEKHRVTVRQRMDELYGAVKECGVPCPAGYIVNVGTGIHGYRYSSGSGLAPLNVASFRKGETGVSVYVGFHGTGARYCLRVGDKTDYFEDKETLFMALIALGVDDE